MAASARLLAGALVVLTLASCVSPGQAAEAQVISLGAVGSETYYASLKLGTPAQEFQFILDTGSSNFAVAGYQASALPSGKFFKSADSSTYQSLNRAFKVQYGSGSWTGTLSKDEAQWVGFDFGEVDPEFAVITKSSGFFTGPKVQGILGLAYQSLAQPGSNPPKPLVEQLVDAGKIENIFGLQLCGPYITAGGELTSGGKLALGGVDGPGGSKLYSGDMYYTPIIEEAWYVVGVTDMLVDGKSLEMKYADYNNPMSIVDSGTTNFAVPSNVFAAIVDKIDDFLGPLNAHNLKDFFAGGAELPLEDNQFQLFPDIAIGVALAGSPKSQFLLTVPPQQYLRLIGRDSQGVKLYVFGIQETPKGAGTILGDAVMEGYYVVFDRANKRIGFATSDGCGSEYPTKPTIPAPSDAPSGTPVPGGSGSGSGSAAGHGPQGSVVVTLAAVVAVVLMMLVVV